jgi:hypothetical protein
MGVKSNRVWVYELDRDDLDSTLGFCAKGDDDKKLCNHKTIFAVLRDAALAVSGQSGN